MLWIKRKKAVQQESLPAQQESLPSLRYPQPGEAVWWAPKQLGAIVTSLNADGSFTFQGGELVKNSKGRLLPRWTVMAGADTVYYDPSVKMWICGQGKLPHAVRGIVLMPEPVQLSGEARGSFATLKEGN